MDVGVGTAVRCAQGTRWLEGGQVIPCGKSDVWEVAIWMVRAPDGGRLRLRLEAQRIGEGAGDQRFRQSMSLAVSKNTMASES